MYRFVLDFRSAVGKLIIRVVLMDSGEDCFVYFFKLL